ncbi:MAG: DUF3034 family protein [Oleiphilaceae bacterium]|nr:DUF3034 family protein [Oleiphilaceae bacterium]
MIKRVKRVLAVVLLCFFPLLALAGDGKLLATAGLNQLEGSGGGGIVPWATLSGYDTREQQSLSVVATQVNVDDYTLAVWGGSVSLYDRIELSLVQQRFDLKTFGGEIRQNVAGLKARLWGDVVYGSLPQFAFGMQYKTLLDKGVAQALGAKNSNAGTDFYLAATKVHLGAVAGYNLVWNLALRASKANQLGLLGYGGDKDDQYAALVEGSVGVLLSRHLAIGAEFRQKPDNLSVAKEDHWRDLFVTYIPNKNVSLTLAWADLGHVVDGVAGDGQQRGLYASLSANLW